ncbi:hypothetical protein OXX79_007957 [Metschnikowia pulcherrima]
MTIDLAEIEKFAIEVAEAAGKILIKDSKNRTSGSEVDPRIKANAVDIVTETDEKVERFIHERISETYPDHAFVGEESYSAGESKNSFVNMAAQVGNTSLPGMCHGVRSLGSAALDLCFVATGAFDIWWEGGCWEWDVCAGFIIVQEAGGLITTANPPKNRKKIPDPVLGSRLYLAIRPAADAENESGRNAQKRVVRAVWDRVEGLDYERPQ